MPTAEPPSSALVVQTQADLLGREVEVGEVAEVSALGAAKLAWRALGHEAAWPTASSGRIYRPILDPSERRQPPPTLGWRDQSDPFHPEPIGNLNAERDRSAVA